MFPQNATFYTIACMYRSCKIDFDKWAYQIAQGPSADLGRKFNTGQPAGKSLLILTWCAQCASAVWSSHNRESHEQRGPYAKKTSRVKQQ